MSTSACIDIGMPLPVETLCGGVIAGRRVKIMHGPSRSLPRESIVGRRPAIDVSALGLGRFGRGELLANAYGQSVKA